MAYKEYNNLSSPDEVLTTIANYVKEKGYEVVQDVVDDLNIYDRTTTDGKKFVFKDITKNYFICLRSANGTQIFGDSLDSKQDNATKSTDVGFYGIGMTVAEGYSNAKRWYAQYNAPVVLETTEVLGVWMPVPETIDGKYVKYTLFCNEVTLPSNTLVFSLMKEDDTYKQCAHLAFCNLFKFEEWVGGALFSGSSNKYDMGSAYLCFNHTIEADATILPLFCSNTTHSNTFLRIDIDEATSSVRGNIFWASSGAMNETGKRLSLPIRTASYDATNGKIPNYYWLQSKDRLDSGKNVNTLNCITVNLPLFVAVLVDPDNLENYASVGTISGVYFVSMLNMQTGCTYEMSYPKSGDLVQAFPMGKRRGHYGFDGISINQTDDTK